MADYIRREDAVHTIMGQPPDAHYPSWYAAQIEDIHAADVVPVVHGRWERYSGITIKCSRCGHVIHDWRYSECKYCPNCGAKMDGGKNT